MGKRERDETKKKAERPAEMDPADYPGDKDARTEREDTDSGEREIGEPEGDRPASNPPEIVRDGMQLDLVDGPPTTNADLVRAWQEARAAERAALSTPPPEVLARVAAESAMARRMAGKGWTIGGVLYTPHKARREKGDTTSPDLYYVTETGAPAETFG